jgi:hypothetical protein
MGIGACPESAPGSLHHRAQSGIVDLVDREYDAVC